MAHTSEDIAAYIEQNPIWEGCPEEVLVSTLNFSFFVLGRRLTELREVIMDEIEPVIKKITPNHWWT